MTEAATSNSGPDINRGRIAAVYASALLGSTDKAGNTAGLLDEFQSLIEEVIDRSPDFDMALSSPRSSTEEKSGLLDRVLGGKASDQLLTFLKVVCQHGRMDCLREIYRSAREEFNRRTGRVAVHATTATPISDDTRNSIVDALKNSLGSEIELTTAIDEELLGGVVIKIGDTVYDGSVLNKLSRLKQETMRNTSLAIREGGNRFANE